MLYETLFLIGGIIFGALGMLAVVASSAEGQSNSYLRWGSWLLYVVAFYLLFFSFEGFGVASGYALWAAGTAGMPQYLKMRLILQAYGSSGVILKTF